MSTMLANQQETFSKFMADPRRLNALAKAAPRHLTPERLLKVATNAVLRNPKLLECDVRTVYAAIVQAAELGLEPGGALGQAYLVPFNGQCQLIVGYQGLIDLVYRSGQVKDVYAQVVYKQDAFRYRLGLEPVIDHEPADGKKEAGDITHAYMVAHLKGGGVVFDVMTRWELDRIRERSRAKDSGPWKTDAAEMYRKTVVRRGAKYLPKSVELSKLFALDNAVDTGDMTGLEFDHSVIEAEAAEPEKGAEALARKVGVKKASELPAKAAPEEGPAGDGYDHLADYCDEERLAEVQAALGGKSLEEFGAHCLAKKIIDPDLILLEARKEGKK